MKQALVRTLNVYYSARISSKRKKLGYIFVLGHVRSGSTLLVHLLNTHPKICCYGESFIRYKDSKDFLKLAMTNKRVLRELRMREDFYADKLLHNKLLLGGSVLKDDGLKCVFILRSPGNTIASMVRNLSSKWSNGGGEITKDKMVEHYTDRLSALRNYAGEIGQKERMVYVSYEEMTEDPVKMFNALGRLLHIDPKGFSTKYKKNRTTGMWGLGDGSDNIKAGRIVKNESAERNEAGECIPAAAREAYESCRDFLEKHCMRP